jgi:hypothetical protein
MMHIDDHPDPEDLSLSLSLSLIPNPESCILILSFYNRLPSACRAGMQRDSDFRLHTSDCRLQTSDDLTTSDQELRQKHFRISILLAIGLFNNSESLIQIWCQIPPPLSAHKGLLARLSRPSQESTIIGTN